MAVIGRKIVPEETNYLASVSDLMAGLLFIFIIATVLQIMYFNEEEKRAIEAEKRAQEIQNKLAGNDIARSDLLKRIQKRLADQGILVSIDPSSGVVRLPEVSITFETGKATLNEEHVARIRIIRHALIDELRCFHSKSSSIKNCSAANPYAHTLDAVFVEGHTDNQPFGGDHSGMRYRML